MIICFEKTLELINILIYSVSKHVVKLERRG